MVHNYVKENKLERAPVSPALLLGALVASAALLAGVALIDEALPEPLPRTAPPELFSAEIAHEHLVNLTSIGPRVAGSYENEVAAVGVLVEAVKGVARAASPHNVVELDLHRASGAFALTFFDGMNNVYRDVQSVVARVRGAGGRSSRTQLLLNCHFDTVPDSPGASDDGAGCAVLLETMRALAASRRPLKHDAVFLLNGAEENIMQASHAFITTHKWAKSIRAFINIEACGAGGREVLFQAGPHDPWIMEVYAGTVPHPFASSLAQELFESGLVPADTDFRVFRDFGHLSGVDLAWSANGYVYHTRLDTADRVPPSALQRTGDNVLALTHGLLASENLESEADPESRQPVFFDVLGVFVVSARAPAALGCACAALALVVLALHVSARAACAQLYLGYGAWWRLVRHAAVTAATAAGAGAAAACSVALLLHAAGARLSFYSRGWLLAPLYALPALASAALLVASYPPPLPVRRGWWAARLWSDALSVVWATLLAGAALLRLRSGFLPLLWALAPALATLATHALQLRGAARATLHAAACLLPAAQTWYLALGSLRMFVPIMGRAGSPALPPDVLMAAVVATLVLAACSWILPLVAAARGVKRLAGWLWAACAVSCALAALTPLGAPYSAERPQRFMVFHVRRSVLGRSDHLYWLPELDANTPASVRDIVPGMREAAVTTAEECRRWVYCGAAYYLPVLGFIPRGYSLPAPVHDVRVHVAAARTRLHAHVHELHLNVTGPSHVVLIVSPVAGGRVTWSSELQQLQEAAPWGERRTYFVSLHTARPAPARAWRLVFRLELPESSSVSESEPIAQVSVAGHDMSGVRAAAHQRLLDAFPAAAAATGWPVDLHLLDL